MSRISCFTPVTKYLPNIGSRASNIFSRFAARFNGAKPTAEVKSSKVSGRHEKTEVYTGNLTQSALKTVKGTAEVKGSKVSGRHEKTEAYTGNLTQSALKKVKKTAEVKGSKASERHEKTEVAAREFTQSAKGKNTFDTLNSFIKLGKKSDYLFNITGDVFNRDAISAAKLERSNIATKILNNKLSLR